MARPASGSAGAGVGSHSPRFGNIEPDLTPPAAATVSRDGVGSGRWKIRGSPRGGAASHPRESGAVRPCFFQTTTVEQPQWAPAGLGLWIGCNPGWRAVAGKQLQQWLFVGWRVGVSRVLGLPAKLIGMPKADIRGCHVLTVTAIFETDKTSIIYFTR